MTRKEFLSLFAVSPLFAQMTLQDLHRTSLNLPNTPLMPLLFVGHGSPMNAIEKNEFSLEWKKIAEQLPKPNAILCVSAHWETQGTQVTAMEKPKTIHDFGGFPKALFDVQYPAPGNPTIAEEVKNLVLPTAVELDHQWGLDHGCWSVISVMYPNADIPVLQLSLDYTKDANYHFQLAKQLQSLRKKGVLIIGSGNMVHNLRILDWKNPNGAYDWAIEANEGLKNMIIHEEFTQLCRAETLSKSYQLAIPTPDHYHPMMYVLGLKNKEENLSFFNDKTVMGSISMTSFVVGV